MQYGYTALMLAEMMKKPTVVEVLRQATGCALDEDIERVAAEVESDLRATI